MKIITVREQIEGRVPGGCERIELGFWKMRHIKNSKNSLRTAVFQLVSLIYV